MTFDPATMTDADGLSYLGAIFEDNLVCRARHEALVQACRPLLTNEEP